MKRCPLCDRPAKILRKTGSVTWLVCKCGFHFSDESKRRAR